MFNPKVVAIGSGIGFGLAFIVGLISNVKFGYVLLRAVIMAVCCGGIAVGLEFVFKKFLAGDSVVDFGMGSSARSDVGSKVDVTVGEEDLPDDDSSPAFSVGNLRPERNDAPEFKPATVVDLASKGPEKADSVEYDLPSELESGIGEKGPEKEVKRESAAKPEEKAVSPREEKKAEPVAVARPEPKSEPKQAAPVESGDEDSLDALPSFENTARPKTESDAPSPSPSPSSVSASEEKDTVAMAQAIRTLLATE